ncbi:glycosyltransferase family 8 protein [Salipiger abyssi]|uniref:glycosyltransferase family 8 protein n=1 Tax=Salipiger abyssi TaxID=1250539 RepID=UPI001A8C0800|nr:glycosyltransferase family 8 protein [Salipiger abyssi]MBN9890478.1 glycosyltransferase family 8 protein [Salipiger abyssi]
MTQDDDTIELVCVTDANYAPHFAALLKSIEANKGPERLRVHAILDGVGPELLSDIRGAVPALEIEAYQVSDHDALKLPPLMHISRATYLRLIMPEVLPPDIHRVLYLDIDMVVTGSLLPLWQSDLRGLPCGAVADHNLSAEALAQRLGLDGVGCYFNAGMLLIDMQAERDSGFLALALDRLTAAPEAYEFADQDALNEVLWQKWAPLDKTWNYQRAFVNDRKVYRAPDTHGVHLPSIIHFTEPPKPWQSTDWHPYAWLYWKYLRLTPFFADIRQRGGVGVPRLVKFWLKYQMALLQSAHVKPSA